MLADLITKPDVEKYVTGEESEEEFGYWTFTAAKHLITGALAIAEQDRDEDERMNTVYELLSAFNAVVERGNKAIDTARRKDLPRLSVDEFVKMLGDVGGAEVRIQIDREGDLKMEQYYVGKMYKPGRENGRMVLVEVPPPKNSGKGKEA